MTKKNDLIRLSLSINKETDIKRKEIIRSGGNISELFRRFINDNYIEIIRELKVGKLKRKKIEIRKKLKELEALESEFGITGINYSELREKI